MYRTKAAIVFSALFFFIGQRGWTKISLLDPWTFNDRAITKLNTLDQSAGFQFGFDGVSPSGADSETKFTRYPYLLHYGVMENLEIGAEWGLVHIKRQNYSPQMGINDLQTGIRYRFFDADRAKRVAGLDAEFGFSFPTASYEKGLGTGGLGILFGWGLILPLDPATAHVGLGFKLNTENSDNVRVGNVFSYNAGFSYPYFIMHKKTQLQMELKGFNHARNKLSGENIGSNADELYIAPGLSWNINKTFNLQGSFLIGLTGASSDIGLNLDVRF